MAIARLTRHPFVGVPDAPRILALIDAMPDCCRHVVDLPWRLSTDDIAEGHDAVYWEDSDGRVVGFAAWQQPWAALDLFLLPGPQRSVVEADLFAWAEARFRERDAERGYPLAYFVEYRDDDEARQRLAEAHGFHGDGTDYYVYLERPLAEVPSVPALPEGFALRELRGADEADAYTELHRAAFESTSMSVDWRRRTFQMPQYRPDLDVVVTAPDGALAGFCVGWYAPTRRLAQYEPVGVHPRYQRLGLARVLLLDMLRRFQAVGAEGAIVQTNVERNPARRAYESVGFRQTHTVRRAAKRVSAWADEW